MSLKRAVTAVVLLLSAPAVFAGIAYRFTTVTTGFADQRMSGSVESDASRMRVNIDGGDGANFPNGPFLLADGSHVSVFDPATKTYYDVTFDVLSPLKSLPAHARPISNAPR